jgi:plasmid stabilization system protein ParE
VRQPRVTFRPKALADVAGQFNYYAEVAGPPVAERFFDAVHETVDSLVFFPRRGWPSRYPWAKRLNLRTWPVDGFPAMMILYRVVRRVDIDVVRVLDARRDLWKSRQP